MARVLLQYNIARRPWQDCGEEGRAGASPFVICSSQGVKGVRLHPVSVTL
jgi:hypothetical protein